VAVVCVHDKTPFLVKFGAATYRFSPLKIDVESLPISLVGETLLGQAQCQQEPLRLLREIARDQK